MPGDCERCLAAGMDEFLSKPFKRDELAAVLARVIPNTQRNRYNKSGTPAVRPYRFQRQRASGGRDGSPSRPSNSSPQRVACDENMRPLTRRCNQPRPYRIH